MPAAVLLPASFVAFCAERFLLAVADRLDAAGADARRGELVLPRAGALVTERQVVLGGAALVAVSLNREVDVGMLREERHISLNRRALVGTNVRFVVVEVNVLDVLAEQVLVGNGRSRRR